MLSLRIIHFIIPTAVSWFGAGLNTLVIKANGGMPVSDMTQDVEKWVVITNETKFVWLSDIIRIGTDYLSIGDILIYLGYVLYLILGIVTISRLWINKNKQKELFIRW